MTDAHHGDLPGGRSGMASVTETGSDSTLRTAWAGESATQLLNASHVPGTSPVWVLGCDMFSFQMATLLNLLSGVRPFMLNKVPAMSKGFPTSPSSYGLSPVWTFLC